MVAETYVRAEGAFPLIGVGGIDSGGAALTKIRAGASLIQLYSALIYKGLGLVEDDQAGPRLDAAAHRPRLAVRNCRRRRTDNHRRRLAGVALGMTRIANCDAPPTTTPSFRGASVSS